MTKYYQNKNIGIKMTLHITSLQTSIFQKEKTKKEAVFNNSEMPIRILWFCYS